MDNPALITSSPMAGGIVTAALLMPEILVGGSALILLMGGVFGGESKAAFMHRLGTLVLIGLAAMMLFMPLQMEGKSLFMGMYVTDAFTRFIKTLLIISTALVFLLSRNWLAEEGRRKPEYTVLMLLSLLGLFLMVSAGDLMSLYMGMELSSLALYVLASFERDTLKSTESGIKYFILGALASGMFLFGASLVYGFSGTTNFREIAGVLAAQKALSPGILTGMVLLVCAFCFKMSAAPFHMWTPDVYEGAPTPVTAYFSTAPKIAAVALFARLVVLAFLPIHFQWQQIVAFASVASMLVGAFGALGQTNIKRLLAYSSIGHIGYILLGISTAMSNGFSAVFLYFTLYMFMSAGTFACLMRLKRDGKYIESISELAGLSKQQPRLAFALATFMFSMAGIPPLAGFFGKMYVFLAAVQDGLSYLAVLGVVSSVVACYYYLKVVKVMYFDEAASEFDEVKDRSSTLVIVLCAAITLLFVFSPAWLVDISRNVTEGLFH